MAKVGKALYVAPATIAVVATSKAAASKKLKKMAGSKKGPGGAYAVTVNLTKIRKA